METKQKFAQDTTLRTTHATFAEADARRKTLVSKKGSPDRVRVRLRSGGRFDVIVLKPLPAAKPDAEKK